MNPVTIKINPGAQYRQRLTNPANAGMVRRAPRGGLEVTANNLDGDTEFGGQFYEFSHDGTTWIVDQADVELVD